MLNYEYAHPEFFYLLLLLPLMGLWYYFNRKNYYVDIVISSNTPFGGGFNVYNYIRPAMFVLQLLALALLIIALARPRTSEISEKTIGADGIDIILAIDISGSMLAEDFKPDRLSASKEVALEFVEGRKNDRLGIVVYSGESFRMCPLTADHNIVKNVLNDVEVGIIDNQSTAIGMGLATAVSCLKDSKAKSKVVILLTDGVNNGGFIDPLTAADIAKKFNVKTYTIGVGTIGEAPYPFKDPFGRTVYQNVPVKIDEDLLMKVSEMTNAKYFRADSKEKLTEIYAEIEEMEKTQLQELTFQQYEEKFFWFAFAGFIILCVTRFLKYTLFKGMV